MAKEVVSDVRWICKLCHSIFEHDNCAVRFGIVECPNCLPKGYVGLLDRFYKVATAGQDFKPFCTCVLGECHKKRGALGSGWQCSLEAKEPARRPTITTPMTPEERAKELTGELWHYAEAAPSTALPIVAKHIAAAVEDARRDAIEQLALKARLNGDDMMACFIEELMDE